ncbi:MAG: hypothetical protein ACI9LO_001769 [Planctomycetota bacterium]|jgi:hypothetical protein
MLTHKDSDAILLNGNICDLRFPAGSVSSKMAPGSEGKPR